MVFLDASCVMKGQAGANRTLSPNRWSGTEDGGGGVPAWAASAEQ